MRIIQIAVALLTLLGVALPATAQPVQVSGKYEEVYIPPRGECAQFDTCDLEQVIFRRENVLNPKQDADDYEMYWTRMSATYVTDSIATIEKYVFVQFVRGCMFLSKEMSDGTISTHFNIIREHVDVPEGRIPQRYSDWVIDSDDADPVYSSTQFSDNRFYYLQWTAHPKWDLNRPGTLYGKEQPISPRVYITASPDAATLSPSGEAVNSSLQFRVCLYKTSEVPRVVSGSNVHFATPIKCFAWSQSFVYDHEAKKWESPVGIVGTCNRPLSAKEETQFESLKTYRKGWNPINMNSVDPEQK